MTQPFCQVMTLQAREGQLEQISQNSSSYAALYYVLLFPKGENRQYLRILICSAQLRERRENARQRDREKWARSQVVFNILLCLSSSYQRWSSATSLLWWKVIPAVVDAQANCEQRKLNWTRTHQYTLRSELYQGLQNVAVHDRHNREDIRPLV